MDLFEKYLNKKKECDWIKLALTDKSYKKVDHNLKDVDINSNLPTLGDAIIKFIYSDILFEQKLHITEIKKKYESDETFVKIVAKHYNLLNYIDFDRKGPKKPQDYNYKKHRGNNPHKYIATAVEAMIAAIYYIENKNLESIREILKS